MSGLARFMDVLRLYTVERHAWTVRDMADALGSPPSTVYRVVAELVQAGLLEASAETRYRLGAAFIEFDRLTRLTDPLVREGSAILSALVIEARIPCVGLLCRLYNDMVMCIADEAAGSVDFRSSYERGRPMPLTRGATSKVILAHLRARRLTSLLGRGGSDDGDLAAFRSGLLDIRRRGFAVTRGEIDPGLVGLAAPVVWLPMGLVASLSLVVRAGDLDPGLERGLVPMLVSAASSLNDALKGAPQP